MNKPAEPKRGAEEALREQTLHYQSQLHLPRRSFWWLVIILTLIVLLAIQLSFYFQQHLRTHPIAQPWLGLLCQWLPCEDNAGNPYQTLRIVSREVIAHPTVAKAVQVNATLINQGEQALALPRLGLSFKNIDGQIIAQRRFSPEEYLADDLDIGAGMPPQQLVRVSLDLVDPGDSAVAFEFEFLTP